jgi:hypothetical protein
VIVGQQVGEDDVALDVEQQDGQCLDHLGLHVHSRLPHLPAPEEWARKRVRGWHEILLSILQRGANVGQLITNMIQCPGDSTFGAETLTSVRKIWRVL